ncbi:MAG: hypothetical protein IT450_05100 [Phycisphaerales bacterium]|nr:hypothetical protein [Phycisphaerales bacterium]
MSRRHHRSSRDQTVESAPRFGRDNPERMESPLWEDLVRTGETAFAARSRIGVQAIAPMWCFSRFGMSETPLPDGRTVFIGGEHEDYYDPDFQIYNDVIVRHPDDRIEIYGYPRSTFPPTDFHSATLVGDAIILIGSLGHIKERDTSRTPVYRLDLLTYRIEQIDTGRPNPGWIHEHTAELVGQAIRVSGGRRVERHVAEQKIVANTQVFDLDIERFRWSRVD